jgi:hypothetical protein
VAAQGVERCFVPFNLLAKLHPFLGGMDTWFFGTEESESLVCFGTSFLGLVPDEKCNIVNEKGMVDLDWVVWVDSEQQRIVQTTTETISRQGAEKSMRD